MSRSVGVTLCGIRWKLLASVIATAAGSWDFTGQLPQWRPNFPDFDCRRIESTSLVDWDLLRTQLLDKPMADWWSLVSEGGARDINLRRALDLIEDWKLPECHFGVLLIVVVRYGICTGSWQPGASRAADVVDVSLCGQDQLDLLAAIAQGILKKTSLELLLGTRWPLLVAFDAYRPQQFYENPELTCEAIPSPILEWSRLRRAFEPDADWLRDARPLVYDRGLQGDWVTAMHECTYGFAMISLWKLVVCAETQAECVSQYSHLVDDLVQTNDWREVLGNSWPIFGFLARVQSSVMRHHFELDFFPEELLGKSRGLLPDGLSDASHVDHRGSNLGSSWGSVAFAGVLRSVTAGVPKQYVSTTRGTFGGPQARLLLYVTMVFGPRYVPYIPRFVSRAAALGLSNLVLFCLDDAAFDSCEALPSSDGRCVRGTPSILNKFTLPLVYMQLGVDVFWLDFDVFLMRDPAPTVLSMADRKQVDLLVSGSFADDCICSGLVFFRATRVAIDWLLTVLSWMYEHVYTHDQQAFSAFLAGRADEDNATTPERISGSKLFRLYMQPEVPRWALLDPVTEFVSARVLNTTGWTGNLQDMIIFHFLHGDSEVNKGHSAYGWNAQHGLMNESRMLLDVFYNQTDERLYTEPHGPHDLSADVHQALLESRRPERPREMLHCGVLQLNPYTPGRLSADG